MLSNNAKRWMAGAASAAILISFSFVGHADDRKPTKININLAVASNFYGVPPSNSAITDIINAFEAENPKYTVTVVDNGATATLASHIINDNTLRVDLFLAADTATPLDLLTNHFDLVAPYNSSFNPPLYTFNYAQGVLALLSNTPDVDVSCDTGGTVVKSCSRTKRADSLSAIMVSHGSLFQETKRAADLSRISPRSKYGTPPPAIRMKAPPSGTARLPSF